MAARARVIGPQGSSALSGCELKASIPPGHLFCSSSVHQRARSLVIYPTISTAFALDSKFQRYALSSYLFAVVSSCRNCASFSPPAAAVAPSLTIQRAVRGIGGWLAVR